jgi:hypothetical protein
MRALWLLAVTPAVMGISAFDSHLFVKFLNVSAGVDLSAVNRTVRLQALTEAVVVPGRDQIAVGGFDDTARYIEISNVALATNMTFISRYSVVPADSYQIHWHFERPGVWFGEC